MLRLGGEKVLDLIKEITHIRIIYLAFFDTFASHNSLKYFLVENDLQYFKFPLVLISELFNIIPSTIMPNKGILYFTN